MRSPSPHISAFPRLTLAVLAALACSLSPARAQDAAATHAVAQVQLAPLPDTQQFNQLVDFRTRPAGESLDAMIQALARSVGLSAITQGIPAESVVSYDFAEPKPFREIWDIVLTLNGLEYVLRGDDIVVVGPPSVLAGLQPQQQSENRPTAPKVIVKTYPLPTRGNSAASAEGASTSNIASQLAAYLEGQFAIGSGVSVTPFEGLGVLSVRGSADQQARVAELLQSFRAVSEIRVRRIYSLSYARASNIAGVLLGSIFRTNTIGSSEQRTVSDLCATDASVSSASSSTGGAEATTGQTPGSGTQTDLSISADSRTNRLIVNAPARIQQEIATLIKALDRPERQVNVQVRIQEVSSDLNNRLGINLTSALGNFASSTFSGDATSGLDFIFDAQKAITGFNLGATLDAFERQGLSRKVDDSNITVLNNGVATLQAGGTIFISIPSGGGDENIERELNYGVLVGFSPQITNDDKVILDVCARVDTPLSELTDPELQNIGTRKLSSRVTLEKNQTIALGGLLQNELTDTTRKVPFLGDIPIAGNLFKTHVKEENNTELLIIVTANVLE